ncbi:hypothetical protein AYJ08_05800 [Brevibacillus sp. SKDU10]|uniref:hypothetical protein n=1 Tax=Brevibacillus sp. SKDU10 TaxID=1247872 RepID=UPI0007C90992|nr:hypothetical protein [Brevibacillus sp. SKDU10]OAJ75130.1 hypothetical protein AYJ08_05800 [Brevibacillus sp. SKDU10]
MEFKKKLNKLATSYKQSKDQKVFNELYREILPLWNQRKKGDARRTRVDEDTIIEMYEDALLKTLEAFVVEKGEFLHLLNQRISQRRIDLYRSEAIRKAREQLTWFDDGCANTLERMSDEFDPNYQSSIEEKILVGKKERDKRELVSHLIESAKTLSDEVTVKILTEFSKYSSPNKLAKALGLHHETVNRKLRRISRLYDANRFGDINDYLAV